MFKLDAALNGLLLSIYRFESLFLIGSQHAALSKQYKRCSAPASVPVAKNASTKIVNIEN